MTNRRLVSLVTGVLVLAIFLPVGLSIWFTHRQAEETFMQALYTYSDLVGMRTQRVINQSKGALRQLERWNGVTCSSPHLLAMRRISYSWRYVREVIAIEGLTPRCSSLESISHAPAFPHSEKKLNDGFRVWLTKNNDLGLSRYMFAIGSERHVVMTDPMSLIDVLSFGAWPVNVALIDTQSQQVIAGTATLNAHDAARVLDSTQPLILANNMAWVIKRNAQLGLTMVTWASLAPLEKDWYRLLAIWLPLGLLISVVFAFILLRLLRRLQSPRYQLQDAIRNREISLAYQPIVALSSGRMVGAEALARWQQPGGDYLPPDIFIPLAVRSGLMPQLTKLIIKTVFADMGAWLQLHPQQHISINLEPCDLHNPQLPALLAEQVAHWQLKPSQIALELTERGFADPGTSGPVIATLRAAGYAIYIDDFGTGYSSLSYLQHLDVDIIKIDKSFVDALEYKTVTPHIIEMAKALRLAMVAEGIETEGQLQWLTHYGVEYGQGWLYSKALPQQEFIQWAENNLHSP
ncbi:EAL domain-containing protein [Vagococcus sp. WN89Y]|uniref:EAL domain-containing protein n=1 Tax=Vagococcus sp. WN89Y TaxID=3457258 RepID=UPI003FCC80D7